MTDRFQQYVAGLRPTTAPDDQAGDDPLRAEGYRAARRVRTFAFPDIWFTDHTGLGHAFQWAHLRRMLRDGKGTRLAFVWPDGEVTLTGRHLDRLQHDIDRRIVAEFFQVTPGHADAVPDGEPVITTMRLALDSESAETGGMKSSGLSLVVPEE